MRALVALTLLAFVASPGFARSPLGESLNDITVAPHWIYDDFPKAVAEAKSSGKPLLIVVRCVPCPPGRALDEKVMQPDTELAALEQKFVCVRLIQTNGLDLNVFQYDFDMSWAAMFLNADMTVYGRYGSRNTGGKDSSDGLLSLPAFKKAAERALKLHAAYPTNKAELAAKTGAKPEYATPTQIPGLTDRPASATERRQCIHCHMVKEYALRAKWQEGRLSTADLWVYPQPANIGLTTDLDDGLRVTSVAAGSPAAAAGVAPGDDLVSINNQPLISLADIQWALHTAPVAGQLSVQLNRGGQTLSKTLAVRGDWKKSDLAWRASSWYGLRQGLKLEPLPAAERQSNKIADDRLALVIKGLFGVGGNKLKESGLKLNDIIVGIDGKTENLSDSDFLIYLRLAHGPKDSVKLALLSGGARKELTIPMW